MHSIHRLVALAGSAVIASYVHAGGVAEHSHNLDSLRHVLETGDVDVHVLSDSIGLPVDKRYTPAIAWIIRDVAGELPTRVAAGAGDFSNRRRFGIGLGNATSPPMNPINTQQGDPYLATDGRVPLVVGGQGQEMPHDGTFGYTTMNGRTGTVARIHANSSNGATTGGALVNVVVPGQANRVIADLFVRPGRSPRMRPSAPSSPTSSGPIPAPTRPSTTGAIWSSRA